MEAAMGPPDASPVNKGKAVDTKAFDTSVEDDETSHDELNDTSSTTSTRLVKFQLFETKAVLSIFNTILILALLYSWIEPERDS